MSDSYPDVDSGTTSFGAIVGMQMIGDGDYARRAFILIPDR